MLKFLLVIAVAAVVIYLLVRLIERRGIRRPRGGGGGGTKPTPRRPMGPDDDPEFLWNLDKKKRHPDEEDK